MRQGTCGTSPKQMRNNDSIDFTFEILFIEGTSSKYSLPFWSSFWGSLIMTSIYLYVPSRTARGGLTATELLYARMPCYQGPQDFLTSKFSPSLYAQVIKC